MSHRPGQPLEVPETETEHGYAIDDYAWGDGSMNVGECRTDLNWPAPRKVDVDAFRAELDDRDRRRAALGGFGFRGVAA